MSDGSLWSDETYVIVRVNACATLDADSLAVGQRGMGNARVAVQPTTVNAGDVIDVRTLVSHIMETGYRLLVAQMEPQYLMDAAGQFVLDEAGQRIVMGGEGGEPPKGFDADWTGFVPRRIINRFECAYNGTAVFHADFYPAVAANSYLTFHMVAAESGILEFAWYDDDGSIYRAEAELTVN